MIDLHCHSNYSDGILSPQELLKKADLHGIKLLALTDHDTMEGSRILMEHSKKHDVSVVTGIELSTRWKKNDIHILGYRIDPDHPVVTATLDKQNNSRIERGLQISARLATLGIEDAYTKACKIAGHERAGRPHFAQVMVDEGMVAERQLAFKRYLGRGKSAYVPTRWIDVEEAVEMINTAGGQAVIAHPAKYSLTRTRLQELIVDFKQAGGSGLEVVSGEMTVTQVQELAGLCQRYDLYASSGSDYHGDGMSRISLGKQWQLPVNCTPVWHNWPI